jgi:hypothetical protein
MQSAIQSRLLDKRGRLPLALNGFLTLLIH